MFEKKAATDEIQIFQQRNLERRSIRNRREVLDDYSMNEGRQVEAPYIQKTPSIGNESSYLLMVARV